MRRSFFEEESSPDEVLSRATNPDPFIRWSAAVELGQINDEWALTALWDLKSDTDENVRTAANSGIRQFSPEVIATVIGQASHELYKPSHTYHEWKTRPLPVFCEESESIYRSVILDILATEGPTVGSRIQRLTGSSMDPNNKFSISKNRLKKLLANLFASNSISRNDFTPASDDLETSTYYLTNLESVVIRPRGTRYLAEIPVTEVQAALNNHPRASSRKDDVDFKFRILTDTYDISPSELFIVGALLEKEWFGLFSKTSS